MEKHRNTTRKSRYFGLLIIFFALTSRVYSISWSSLRIVPEKEYCFTGETCLFTLELPGILPTRVNVTVQSTPANVTIESITKDEYLKNGVRGTIIRLNFRFSKAGEYQIPALAPLIDWISRPIKFLPITVYDNPILLEPALTSNIPKTLEVGKPTTFTITGKFFNEFTNITSQLDTNLILEKTKNLQSLPFHIGSFSTETYDLAEFTIIPLKEGTFTLPLIQGSFRTYAGNTVNISLPTTKIKVVQGAVENTTKENETANFLSENFPEAILLQKETNNIPQEKINLITILEKELEKQSTLTILFIISGSMSLLCLILIIIFALLKYKKTLISISLTFLIFLTTFIIFAVNTKYTYGLSLGSSVKTVPEESSNTVMQLTIGDKITILDSVADWYSIESLDKRKGWIKKSETLIISKENLTRMQTNNDK